MTVPLWKVLVHDDPHTHFDFVIGVLIEVFHLSKEKAYRITLEAHQRHVALVVIEPKERAEFHVDKAHSLSRTRKFPLTFSMEPA